MGWSGKKEVSEVEHVRGSRILSGPTRKNGPSVPRWYESSDPTTHDLPQKPENYVEGQERTSSRELVLEDIELPDETATKHLVVSGGTGAGKTQAIHRVLDRVLWGRSTERRRLLPTAEASSSRPGAGRPILC